MKLETLDVLKDEDLRAVIGRAEELLKQHDRERKDKALEDARVILEAAGLNLRDVLSKRTNGKSGKGPVYHSGHRYQHPSKFELVWTARGQKPGWLRQLEKEGSRAMELPGDDSPQLAQLRP
jgi:DNA-binding protein H-NS